VCPAPALPASSTSRLRELRDHRALTDEP